MARQRYAISMAYRWRAICGPLLCASWGIASTGTRMMINKHIGWKLSTSARNRQTQTFEVPLSTEITHPGNSIHFLFQAKP